MMNPPPDILPPFVPPPAPCPVCGAEPDKRRWYEYMGRDFPSPTSMRIRSPKHELCGSAAFPLERVLQCREVRHELSCIT